MNKSKKDIKKSAKRFKSNKSKRSKYRKKSNKLIRSKKSSKSNLNIKNKEKSLNFAINSLKNFYSQN